MNEYRLNFLLLGFFGAVAACMVITGCGSNSPPGAPLIVGGDTTGEAGYYTFRATASDPEGDSVSLRFNWGTANNDTSTWGGWIASEDTAAWVHYFGDTGQVSLRCQARDVSENESEWSQPFVLTITSKIVWTNYYGGSGEDAGMSIAAAAGGGYVIAGYTNSYGAGSHDAYLVKIDDNGNFAWGKTQGGAADDYASAVVACSDGGYLMCGQTAASGGNDLYMVKVNSSGDLIWEKTYGGLSDDRGYAVDQTSDGGYIAAGVTYSYGTGGDIYLVKTDAAGDTIWTRSIGGPAIETAYGCEQTADGGYIIVGFTTSYGAGSADVYLVKTDAGGDTVWTRTFGSSAWDRGNSVRQLSDGGYIIGAGNGNVYLIRTNAAGSAIFEETYGNYGGGNDDYGYCAIPTSDGGFACAGVTSAMGEGMEDVYLVKADANGNMEWERTSGGINHDLGYSVVQNADGTYTVCGKTNTYSVSSYDIYAVKMAQ